MYTCTYTYICVYVYIYNDSFKFIETLQECLYTLCPDNLFQLSTIVPEMAS